MKSPRNVPAPVRQLLLNRGKPSPLAIQKIDELLRSMGDNGVDLLKRYLESKNYGVIL